jgi:hypothetical protein
MLRAEIRFSSIFILFYLKLRNHIPRETCNTTPQNQGEITRRRRSTKCSLPKNPAPKAEGKREPQKQETPEPENQGPAATSQPARAPTNRERPQHERQVPEQNNHSEKLPKLGLLVDQVTCMSTREPKNLVCIQVLSKLLRYWTHRWGFCLHRSKVLIQAARPNSSTASQMSC